MREANVGVQLCARTRISQRQGVVGPRLAGFMLKLCEITLDCVLKLPITHSQPSTRRKRQKNSRGTRSAKTRFKNWRLAGRLWGDNSYRVAGFSICY